MPKGRTQWWHLDDQPSCLFLNLDQLGNIPAGKMTPIGWRCENAQYWASWRKFWSYTALYKVLLRAQEITTWSHIQFDRPRHLCSKPAQATSSESSTAQSSERPSWSQPMSSCTATEKWWVQPSSLSKRKANISNVYKCIVSNIAIYDYPYHDWFYIRVYNIIYTYMYVYIYISSHIS